MLINCSVLHVNLSRERAGEGDTTQLDEGILCGFARARGDAASQCAAHCVLI